jgi:hypothetical protein
MVVQGGAVSPLAARLHERSRKNLAKIAEKSIAPSADSYIFVLHPETGGDGAVGNEFHPPDAG